jgi:hypothetical protein
MFSLAYAGPAPEQRWTTRSRGPRSGHSHREPARPGPQSGSRCTWRFRRGLDDQFQGVPAETIRVVDSVEDGVSDCAVREPVSESTQVEDQARRQLLHPSDASHHQRSNTQLTPACLSSCPGSSRSGFPPATPRHTRLLTWTDVCGICHRWSASVRLGRPRDGPGLDRPDRS